MGYVAPGRETRLSVHDAVAVTGAQLPEQSGQVGEVAVVDAGLGEDRVVELAGGTLDDIATGVRDRAQDDAQDSEDDADKARQDLAADDKELDDMQDAQDDGDNDWSDDDGIDV